jgi:pilus assembly protein CpaE
MLAEKVTVPEGLGLVALVSPNAELHQRLRAAFKDARRSSFIAIQGAIAEVEPQLAATNGPSVLVVDLEKDSHAAIASLGALRANGFGGAIVTISHDLDESAVRGMLRLSVSDWLPGNAPTEEILRACEQALTHQDVRPTSEPGTAARCVSFVPAAGGVGTTTLAIQAAFLMAGRQQQFRSTCLIDLNFRSGALADYLDLAPSFDVNAVSMTPHRLDARLLEVMLSRHPSGIAVLAAPRLPTSPHVIEEAFVGRLLGTASEMFANIVIDMPPTWMPWSEGVVAGSDQVFVVTEFTVPALRKARELMQEMLPLLAEGADARVIVNKTHEQLLGGGLRKRDVSELLGNYLGGFVSEDKALVRDAINRGEPLSAGKSSNRLARELAKVIAPAAAGKGEGSALGLSDSMMVAPR